MSQPKLNSSHYEFTFDVLRVIAILSVVGAWGWIAWQTRRTRRKPATSTLFIMGAASVLLTIAVLWPLLEKPLIRMLRA